MPEDLLERYLRRHGRYPAFVGARPRRDLGLVVVIPSLAEPALPGALQALEACASPSCAVEIIVVLNHAITAPGSVKALNRRQADEVQSWAAGLPGAFTCHVLYLPDLPVNVAGVGLARKAGMDEAARRLAAARQLAGVIACFDADCTCDTNYLLEIEHTFGSRPELEAVSISFEHPLAEAPDAILREGIMGYELHLRYFIRAQKYAGFPFAFHTVGSAMAVRARAYLNMGGMNTRKAGEDFYFLHKFIERGHTENLTTTTVYPAPRVSDRVPFGTGKTLLEYRRNPHVFKTYHPQIFEDLSGFIQTIPELSAVVCPDLRDWPLADSMTAFLEASKFSSKLAEIQRNTTSVKSFTKRMFQWFNAFRLMKYVHFARDRYYENVEVRQASMALLERLGQQPDRDSSLAALLDLFRLMDRER